jgi:autoinducer 2 (AI-2) kinase
MQQVYLVIDVGTGNLRVAVATKQGEILGLQRSDIDYIKDEEYPDALYFDPNNLWDSISFLAKEALKEAGNVEVIGLTATSQREGIVLIDQQGKSLIGLPNIDHRGREWEQDIKDKDMVYRLTGRYASSLFSAFKLVGVRNRKSDLWAKFSTFLSISDWVEYKLSGILHYEHSQASETLLYDVEQKQWSEELLEIFGLDKTILPQLVQSGTILGSISEVQANNLGISSSAQVIVGGADTQLAVLGAQPDNRDIVIVSGTTTPIIKLTDKYLLDDHQRTWTGRHVDQDSFMLETNAGVTGLNYQRLKEIFYPNEGYDVIEKEVQALKNPDCIASLGSLVADEKEAMTKGGFIFDVPVSHQISRAGFIYATLWDIACSIKENYDTLCETDQHEKDFIWACGGGFQSTLLKVFIASLIQKKVIVRKGYQQSSVIGGVIICNQALGGSQIVPQSFETVSPKTDQDYLSAYKKWKAARKSIKEIFN